MNVYLERPEVANISSKDQQKVLNNRISWMVQFESSSI